MIIRSTVIKVTGMPVLQHSDFFCVYDNEKNGDWSQKRVR